MFILNLLSEEGPNTELAWLLWSVLGFFFLMIVIGWFSSLKPKPDDAPVHTGQPSEH